MDDAEGFLRQKSQAVTESIDSKKWVWIEDKAEGYLSAKILEVNGETLSVEVNTGQRLTVKRDLTQQMNPTKYDKAEDMAALTYLNEAGVLNNLKQRYFSGMIYTYSGLFCVAVNPYRRLPIYTDKVVEMYKGKRRAEMPPHIFSITDNAYNEMLQERENQSILITGESGAGKTENTKKVIQYVATVAGTGETKSEKKQNLEDQIVQANPLMEAFGNAKTIRNNNSSRFGKFIRVHFGLHGKIAGADVESYLLEKSRVVSQTSEERNYHVFYQILTAADDQMKEKYLVTGKPEDYKFLSEGVARIDAVDDEEEWHATCDSMKTLRFTDEERGFLIKVVMAILHFGNVKFKQRPREEQAECPDTADAEKVAFLLGIQVADLVRSLLRPRIRVGHEYVQQGRNYEQVVSSVAALSKSLYDRMFKWLIARINKTLETKFSKNYFIGVLDIAGFEIFQVNLFEQLSINYTNEKLQQFFNHHMFILEQEEYKKENIDWEFIDFGHDLQPCIDLIEKKLGILSILDEESIYPKASDKTFIEKLKKNHDGKSPKFKLPKMSSKNKAHFEIEHYAGTVGYTVMGWLEKNKDPLNDSVVDLLRKSTDPIIASLFADHQPEGSRKKGSQFLTVSQLHKEQLEKLMVNLRNTTPHFVRCIIPNEKKKPGIIEANLVLHQLRCNGVLEGIRICRKGFPNRIIFSEFKQRYAILAPGAIPSGMFMDGRKAAAKLVDALQLEPNEFRMGTTKVFFRAGVIGRLEESRDEKLYAILSKFQARMRGFLMRKTFQKMQEQRSGLQIIQRNVRKYIVLRNWQWWRLFTKVKPLLNVARSDEELKHMQEELNRTLDKSQKEESLRKDLEEQNTKLVEEKQQLFMDLQREQDAYADAEDKIVKLESIKNDMESQIQELNDQLEEEEDNNAQISQVKRKLEAEVENLRTDIEDIEAALQKSDQEKQAKDDALRSITTELDECQEAVDALTKDKKALEEKELELSNLLEAEEDKSNHLTKVKNKLETSLEELQSHLDYEKKHTSDLDKAKRKLESEAKVANEKINEMEGNVKLAEETIHKRDNEISKLGQSLEDERTTVAALQKKLREAQSRIDELEEEFDNERVLKLKIEKQKAELLQELDELNEKLDEAGGAHVLQTDLTKKREAEINRLQSEIESRTKQHGSQVASMKKKHNEIIDELENQVETLQRAKNKLESEKQHLSGDLDELQSNLESLTKAKNSSDKQLRQLDEQYNEASAKVDEQEKIIADLQAALQRLQAENNELSEQVEDGESKINSLTKAKKGLESQLEELKRKFEDESQARSSVSNNVKNLQAELEQTQELLDEEQESKAELQRQLTKANADAATWRNKYEIDGAQRVEELEDIKRKLTAKLTSAEELADEFQMKFSSAEKSKNRLSTEMEDLLLDLERAQNQCAAMEKKQRKVDAQTAEWRNKHDTLTIDLENAQREYREQSTELFRVKGSYQETAELVDGLRRENKQLQNELSDLSEQLNSDGRNAAEIEKVRRKLEVEKEEIALLLEEAEASLEQEENKVLRMQLEQSQLKQEFERRIHEKEEEMEGLRKNHQRQLEAVNNSLGSESKSKSEQIRLKKKLEAEITELELTLEAANKSNADLNRSVKKYQSQVKELQSMIDDEQRVHEDYRDKVQKAERRANDVLGELEDLRASLEQSERVRKQLEVDQIDLQERVQDLTTSNSAALATRKKLETEIESLHEEIEELEGEAKSAEDKYKRANEQIARLTSEIATEHDEVSKLLSNNAALEKQMKEMEAKLNDSELAGGKASKRHVTKLEARIRELEADLEAETKQSQEATKQLRKNERRLKELQFSAEEDRKNLERTLAAAEKNNHKMRVLRRQLDEAEEQTTQYQSKVRKLQHEIEECEERAEAAESALAKAKSRARIGAGSGVGGRRLSGRPGNDYYRSRRSESGEFNNSNSTSVNENEGQESD